MTTTPQNDRAFQGFEAPMQNWSKLPHQLIDVLPLFETLAEMKVVLYILRHTWGYSEFDKPKAISLDEFEFGRRQKDGTRMDNGVGMSRPSIVNGLKRAEEHGFITVITDASDKARVKKLYSIRMQGLKDLTPGVKELNSRGKETLHRSEKETLERNTQKENNNATASQGVSAQPQPTSDIDFPEPKPRKQHTPESIREDTANAIAEFERRNGRLRESPWAEIIRDASILAVADSFTQLFSYTFAVPNSNRLRRQCVDGFKQIYDEAGSAEIAERLLAELARRHKRKQDGYTFTINGPHSIVKSLPRLKAELKRKEGRNGDSKNGRAKPLTQWQTEPTTILGWDGTATVER